MLVLTYGTYAVVAYHELACSLLVHAIYHDLIVEGVDAANAHLYEHIDVDVFSER